MARLGALFDLDRTLIRRDTAGLYARYRRDRGDATWRELLRIAGWRVRYSIGLVDGPRVAREALAGLRGTDEWALIESCEKWFRDYALAHVQPAGRAAVERHRAQGEVVALVTGATRYLAGPLAAELGLDLIVCTELEVDPQGRLTGRPIEPLCHGAGKLERTRQLAEREGFDLAEATFYSDSIRDLALFEAVRFPRAVNPDAQLRRVARRRGWPVEVW